MTVITGQTEAMGGYRARRHKLQELAAAKGIEPTPLAMSKATGISHRVMKGVFLGEPVSARTIRRLLEVLGGKFDQLFEPGE